jgi:hypothetical protein
MIAIFQGYLAFARHNHYWMVASNSWGYTLGPYALIGAFLLFVLVWMTKTRLEQREWTWQTPSLERVNLSVGRALEHAPYPEEKNLWRRGWQRFLEAL